MKRKDGVVPANHPAIVDEGMFTAAQELRGARSRNRALCASNASDYVLKAGLHGAAHAAARTSAAAPTGTVDTSGTTSARPARSRDRQRATAAARPRRRDGGWHADGASGCGIRPPTTEPRRRGGDQGKPRGVRRAPLERESAAADLVQVRKKIERYLAAFEAGDLAADDVGARLRDLRSQEANLDAEVRRLDSLLEAEPITPTALELEPLRVEIEQVLCDGDPKQLKRPSIRR